MVYCCEGIKKLFLKTPKVNDVLEVIHQNIESNGVLKCSQLKIYFDFRNLKMILELNKFNKL